MEEQLPGPWGLPVALEQWGLAMGDLLGQDLAARAHPLPQPGALWELQLWGIRHLSGDGDRLRPRMGHGAAGGSSSAGLVARQGCGKLETSSAVASLGQGLVAPGKLSQGSSVFSTHSLDTDCWPIPLPACCNSAKKVCLEQAARYTNMLHTYILYILLLPHS